MAIGKDHVSTRIVAAYFGAASEGVQRSIEASGVPISQCPQSGDRFILIADLARALAAEVTMGGIVAGMLRWIEERRLAGIPKHEADRRRRDLAAAGLRPAGGAWPPY